MCRVLYHFGSDTCMKQNLLLFLLQSSRLVAHATELEDILLLFLSVFCCETVSSPWVSCISANLASKHQVLIVLHHLYKDVWRVLRLKRERQCLSLEQSTNLLTVLEDRYSVSLQRKGQAGLMLMMWLGFPELSLPILQPTVL